VGAEGEDQLAAQPKVVTAADVVTGHVRLDISCLDRLYLNGYVAKLQTPGGVVWFFHEHRGKPIVSPALFEPIGQKFRREVRDWAQANGVPLIRFSAGERKARGDGPLPGDGDGRWTFAGGGGRVCAGVPAGVDGP